MKITKEHLRRFLKARFFIPATASLFLLLYVFILLTGDPSAGGGRNSSFNQGERGYFLFHHLFVQLDYRLQRHFQSQAPEGRGCLIYFDYFPSGNDQLQPLLDWVKKGNVLYMVGIFQDRDPIFSRKIQAAVCDGIVSKTLTFSPRYVRSIKKQEGDQVLLHSGSDVLVMGMQLGQGRVFLIPDNFLFVNSLFTNPNHAVFLNSLFAPYFNNNIYIYEYGTNVYKVKQPILILFRGKLLYITLQLMLLGLVFLLWRSKQFGKPRRFDSLKRRSLSNHLTAVADFYRKAGALKLVDSLSRNYFIYRARQMLNIKTKPTASQLSEKIAEHTGETPEMIKQLIVGGDVGEQSLLKKRKDIYRLLKKINAGHGLKIGSRMQGKKSKQTEQALLERSNK